MKKIAWITGDYFIDVDIPVVPFLRRYYDIEWYVIQGANDRITIPKIDGNGKMNLVKMPYRMRDVRSIGVYAEMARKIKAFAPDIIYVDALELPYMYFVLDAYLPRKKMVHAAHNVIPYEGWPHRRMMQAYLGYIFATHKYFHIFSKHTEQYFKQHYPQKETFCTPLSLKDYGAPSASVAVPEDKICFLFFGNVKQNKRLDILLKAYGALPKELLERSHLSVMGACEHVDVYKSLMEPIKDYVTFIPNRIADEAVPDIFATHHYLVLPYENVAQSGPHMVAYNYGMPVIATDIAGFTEHITDGADGYLFHVNDVEHLKQVLSRAITGGIDKYHAMRRQLLLTVEQGYSRESLLEKYCSFFNAMV